MVRFAPLLNMRRYIVCISYNSNTQYFKTCLFCCVLRFINTNIASPTAKQYILCCMTIHDKTTVSVIYVLVKSRKDDGLTDNPWNVRSY